MADEFGARDTGGSRHGEGERYGDPYGLYRHWFEAWEGARRGDTGAAASSEEIEEMWRRWFRGMAQGLRPDPSSREGFAEGLNPLWDRMAESFREEAMSGGEPPKDPVEFFLSWYEATNEEWTKAAEELLGKREYLESNARLQRDAARSYKELKRASEESLKRLQIPSRSDVAGVAKLVVGVENKLDRLEDAFGEFVYGGSEPATAESVRGLEERMDRLEEKMDRVLAALEKSEPEG